MHSITSHQQEEVEEEVKEATRSNPGEGDCGNLEKK